MVQLRVYARDNTTPYDLSTVGRAQLLADIVGQAHECGHSIHTS
jgi:hypothetical protein